MSTSNRLSRLMTFFALVLMTLVTPSCKPAAKKEGGGKAKAKTSDAQPSNPPQSSSPSNGEGEEEQNGSDCKNTSSSDDEEDAEEEGTSTEDEDEDLSLRRLARGFGLVDEVTYEDVKPILESKCILCHAGKEDPDISTYKKAKAKAQAIFDSIDDGSMPPTGSVSSADQKKIENWIADGLKEKPTTDDEEKDENTTVDEEEDKDTSSGTSDCDDEDDDGGSDLDEAMEALLNPPGLKECKDEGKVYDRGKKKCHAAKIATWDCSVKGVIDAFKPTDVSDGSGKIKGFEEYEVDQCGELDGDPVAFFYKKVTGEDEVGLDIKLLCKKGSPACKR